MAFVLPRGADPLTPRPLALRVAPGTQHLPAAEWLQWQDAAGVVDGARAEAARILATAQAEREAERARGHAEGREEAQLEASEGMLEQVARTVDFYAQVEERLADLVLAAVQRVVADFDDRARALAVVKGALGVVRNQKQVLLRVAPAQHDAVRAATNELLTAFPGVGYIDIVADARLATDACIVETEIGVVEASIDGQLQAMRRAFTHVLGSRS